jgi:hypothetical protein
MATKNHTWSFSSVGGVKRVNFESGQDIVALEHLDQKLWTALSCPVHGLEIDSKTLELIDEDKDGQIRVTEILAASKWITSVINNPDDLLKQNALFPLSAINDNNEEGKILLASAKTILKNLGKADATSLSVEETSDISKIFEGTAFNGDGIISEDSCSTIEQKKLLKEITTSLTFVLDRGGKEGINTELLESFISACNAYSDWYKKAEENEALILPFKEHTEDAYQSFLAIKSKIDDYFIRCRLAAFDTDATAILNLLVNRIETITAKDLSTCMDEIASYPLAKIEAGKALPLLTGINPAWEKQLTTFKQLMIAALYPNKETMDEAEWNFITEKFNAYANWQSEKEGQTVESLGLARVREILSTGEIQQLFALIEKDKSLETEANNIILVDKMVRYYRDLFTLIKNFVTFYDFYSPEHPAIFQSGTLYIDQRSCDLCIRVNDMPKHNTMVAISGMFLIYCNCVSKSTNETMTIVAALTNGDIDNLVVGRNAIFYDRKGNDYDATVIKIVENPISIIQAFWSPYRRVSRFIENQINKFATEQDKKIEANAINRIEAIPAKVAEHKPIAAPPPFDLGKFVGIFAAIGLALGAIGTAVASVVSGFMGLVWWQMPIAIFCLIMLVSGPAMIIAFLKLRKRNLAPILDANGWAINAKAIVNIAFGNTLTQLADLPYGAKINLNDPFRKKTRPLWQVILIISMIAGGLLYLLLKFEFITIPF